MKISLFTVVAKWVRGKVMHSRTYPTLLEFFPMLFYSNDSIIVGGLWLSVCTKQEQTVIQSGPVMYMYNKVPSMLEYDDSVTENNFCRTFVTMCITRRVYMSSAKYVYLFFFLVQ